MKFVSAYLLTRWEMVFSAMVEFKKNHGHCNVPIDWPENPELGTWVAN